MLEAQAGAFASCEHAAFLAPGAEDADSRLDFLTGTLILLRRLSALGLRQNGSARAEIDKLDELLETA